jgi:hypothetical protein
VNTSANGTQGVNPAFRKVVDEKLDALVHRFYTTIPFASHQMATRDLNIAYYKRHTIETILRIRRKRSINALVLHYLTRHDSRQAKAWAQYIEEEMLHDELFAKDLERLGVSHEEIDNQEPFLATKLLIGYFTHTLDYEGPMASIAGTYFLEYAAKKTQPAWIENLEKLLGAEKIRGARTHVDYDIGEGHPHFVWNVLMSLVRKSDDETRVLLHMDHWYGLFCAYFTELYDATVTGDRSEAAIQAPIVAIRNANIV